MPRDDLAERRRFKRLLRLDREVKAIDAEQNRRCAEIAAQNAARLAALHDRASAATAESEASAMLQDLAELNADIERASAEIRARYDAISSKLAEIKNIIAESAAARAAEHAEVIADWKANVVSRNADSALWRADKMIEWLAPARDRLADRLHGKEVPDSEVAQLATRVGALWLAFEVEKAKGDRVVRMRFLTALEHAKDAAPEREHITFIDHWGPHLRARGLLFPEPELVSAALAQWRRGHKDQDGGDKWEGLARIIGDVGLAVVKGSSLRAEWKAWARALTARQKRKQTRESQTAGEKARDTSTK